MVTKPSAIANTHEPKGGKVIWQQRFQGKQPFRASPTGADGKVYCINKSGEVFVVAASDQYKLLQKNTVKGYPCLSTIAIAGGRLYVRTSSALYCIGR